MQLFSSEQLKLSVLISLGNSSGSGFLYRTDVKGYLVTAKHVLFNDSGLLRSKDIEIACQTINAADHEIQRLRINLQDSLVKFHKNADVCIVEIANFSTKPEKKLELLESVEILQRGTPAMIVSRVGIRTFSEVLISNDVFVFGYPTSLGIEASRQFDFSKPLLRKGIVANTFKDARTIILDCPVYAGNSGGPVVQVEESEIGKGVYIIGVISQYIPYVSKWHNDRERIVHSEHLNSGYSVATSMDCVLELLE